MKKNTVEDLALFGGKPIFDSFRTTMNLVKPDRKVFFHYAKKSFNAHHLTNNGPSVRELEKQLTVFHDVEHCIAFCNGFTGIFLALHELAIPGKKEVIIPSFTYRRMADIIDWAGLIPRFCDVDPFTLGISSKTVRPCITEETALILAPHPITHLCDIEGIESLAKEYNLPLIFDSVEACGGMYNGKKIGSFGDCEAFSMHASKVINASEGGYITTNNSTLAGQLKKVRAFGFHGKDHIECLGFNAKLNELHAAMALATLSCIDDQLNENKKVHLAYQKNLSDIPGLYVHSYDLTEQRNWKSLLLYLDAAWPLKRETTLQLLNAENIYARAYYYPALHTTSPKQASLGKELLPITMDIMNNYLILPVGSTVNTSDTFFIGEVLRFIYDHSVEICSRLS